MSNTDETKQRPTTWDDIRGRAAVSLDELCDVVGRSRGWYYRHKDSIKTVEGYGRRMIPISEVRRIAGIETEGGK